MKAKRSLFSKFASLGAESLDDWDLKRVGDWIGNHLSRASAQFESAFESLRNRNNRIDQLGRLVRFEDDPIESWTPADFPLSKKGMATAYC